MPRLSSWSAACVAVLALAGSANADPLLQFNTVGNLGTETSEPSIANDANVTAANFVLGAGVTPAANGNRLGGNNWSDTGDSNPTTLAESIAGNDYLEVTLTPVSGFQAVVTDFSFIFGRSGTGPSALTLRSSQDSFATDLASVSGLVDSTTVFTTLTVSGLNPITSATTFRLYGYGSTAAAGTGGFDTANAATAPNVLVNGSTSAVPEPASAGVLGLVGLVALGRRKRATR